MKFKQSVLVAFIGIVHTVCADTVIYGHPADRALDDAGNELNAANMRVGWYNDTGMNATLVFELPVLEYGESVTNAHVQFTISSVKEIRDFNVDLYGIAFQSAGPSGDDYYAGEFLATEGDGNVGLQDNVTTNSAAAGIGGTSGAGDAAVAEWIQGFYEANPDYSGGTYAIFRLNPDVATDLSGTGDTGYNIQQGNASTTPVLTLMTKESPGVYGHPSDRMVNEDGGLVNAANMRVGWYESIGRNATLIFELPVLEEAERITDARLQFSITSVKTDRDFNVDLYGIAFQVTGPSGDDYYAGEFLTTDGGDNIGLQDNVITNSAPAGTGTTSDAGGAAVAGWIQSFYDATPDYSGGTYAIFRLSQDASTDLSGTGDTGYNIAQGDALTTPRLTMLTTFDPVAVGSISMSFRGSDAVVSWQGAAGGSYILQGRSDLLSGSWSNLHENISGFNGSMSVTNGISKEKEFYRIVTD
jgi:hypothetical protein